MKKSVLKIFTIIMFGFILNVMPLETKAQCPMCKMSAEQNLKDGGTAGKGLNAGILYMFFSPYLLVATVGFLWWRNRKKEEEIEV